MKKYISRKGLLSVSLLLICFWVSGQTIYVSPRGNDQWTGTEEKPVATFAKAQQLARSFNSDTKVEVIFEDGIYYLPETIQFTKEDSKEYPVTVTYRARNEGKAVISGGSILNAKWIHGDKDVYITEVPKEINIDQLYVNGVRQRMARFPNANPGNGKNVYDTWVLSHEVQANPNEDPLNDTRVAGWKNPAGAYLHSMHNSLWGDMHWEIQGKKMNGTLDMIGGWQNNRPSPMHPVYRMVENIKEELDVPEEWFFDKEENKLYYIPPTGVDMKHAKVEIVRLRHLIEFNGNKQNPVQGVNIKGFVFRHASRTFMDNKEQLLRSDWTVYRGGAVVYNGAEDCLLESCEFDQVGGNTIFVNNYNRRIIIKSCYIHDSGANGVIFVGDPTTVRNPLFRYGNQDYSKLDKTFGPKSDNYPQECTVEDCIITMTGRDEKQTAPIQISMSHRIRISHCSIYDVPRAGININEGTFGGHIIEYCDVFNTVLETGDHGSFNSWGRDRFWTPDVNIVSKEVAKSSDMPYWDILEPNIIRNSRWKCDHGWDIDLDDGSTFYRIYNNLMLGGGIKLREGYDRIVTNNIIVNNTLHPHVWVKESRDVFKHNIVFGAYRPAAMNNVLALEDKWGKELDYNLFVSDEKNMTRYVTNGADLHSKIGNPLFVDISKGDFRVMQNSPAFQIGFQNFDMSQFGIRSKKLKTITKVPVIPKVLIKLDNEKNHISKTYGWLGAIIKEPKKDELSAYGVSFDWTGIAFDKIPDDSKATQAGFNSGDLIQSINGIRINGLTALKSYIQKKQSKTLEFLIIRNQKEITLNIKINLDKKIIEK